RRRDINCDSSPSFTLEKDALSVVLAKAAVIEEASSVRQQVWFIIKVKTTKKKTSSVVCRRSRNCKKKIFHVWFIKSTTVKDDDPCMILHQSRNCRRTCTKCGSSLKLQLQKKRHQVWFVAKVAIAEKRHQVWFVIKVETTKFVIKDAVTTEDARSVVHLHQSHNC
ncbi:hypothetical protein H5410_002120, partial [Solanum commersonii]